MTCMRRLSVQEKNSIIDAYLEDLDRVRDIAARYGVSRAAIYKTLAAHGVKATGRTKRRCGTCGAQMSVTRGRARKSEKVYCSTECYMQVVRNPTYRPRRQGQRIARRTVREFYPLEPQHIVHHIDGDQSNNAPNNLMVFKDHADHMRWHRTQGQRGAPLWRG